MHDALSGRYLTIHDDVAALVERAAEIQRDHLYTLRHTLLVLPAGAVYMRVSVSRAS